jgi:mono/diheme cytochrome c family protein
MTTKVMVLTTLVAIVAAGALRAQQPADGAALYTRMCASCHGAKGTPNPAMARSMQGLPDFAASSTASVPDSVLRSVIENGKGRIMMAYKSRLTAAQIASLVAYIKTFRSH